MLTRSSVISPLLDIYRKYWRASLLQPAANETVHRLIEIFTSTANAESENGHSVASYYVAHDLSLALFKIDLQKEPAAWKKLTAKQINTAAAAILAKNTAALKIKGADVEAYIGK